MHGIDKIHSNDFGISFYWKTSLAIDTSKVQLIFRDIGFLLTLQELKLFATSCSLTYINKNCETCRIGDDCRNLLLKTPSEKIDLAISVNELEQIRALLDTTILKVELHTWIAGSVN